MTVNDKLRILLIVFNQVGRGTYWRAFYFGHSLAARGHTVTLMAMSVQARLRLRETQVAGIQLVETPDILPGPLRSGWDVWEAARRIGWLAGRSFDIVHAFEARPTVLIPALVARQRGAKLVMDWCDWFGRGGSVEERSNPVVRTILRPVETFFEEKFRILADATTVINHFLYKRAQGLGVKTETILLVRNGANGDAPLLDRLSARQRVGLTHQGTVLGYVGGLYAQDAVLMAQALARVRQVKPDTKLLLVGHFNRDIGALLNDASPIVRTGPVLRERLQEYLSACDVCWLPLKNSGANRGRWPLKLSDYMAAGRPVVATDVGDMAEVVRTHHLGVIASDNPDDFAAATLDLLADPQRQQELGQSARRAAQEVFSWDRLAGNLERHYWCALNGSFN